MTTPVDSTILKAYDVRGIVGESITEESVRAVGAAFVDVLGLSGPARTGGRGHAPLLPRLRPGLRRGARPRGADVVMLGLVSTDELYYACGAWSRPPAWSFTASHNPAAYNGMKMAKAGAVPGVLRHRAVRDPRRGPGLPRRRPDPRRRDRGRAADVLAGYADYLRSLVDLSGIRR